MQVLLLPRKEYRGENSGSRRIIEEESEELGAPEPRKSRQVAVITKRRKAVMVYSKSSRRKGNIEKPNLLQLDDVPRKKRKLLEASGIVASRVKVCFYF